MRIVRDMMCNIYNTMEQISLLLFLGELNNRRCGQRYEATVTKFIHSKYISLNGVY